MKVRFLLIMTMLAIVGGVAYAGTSPIAGMAGYDGTYFGSPSTGSICDSTTGCQQFTTLYRDNYNRTSGCAGERCGKHPGVDISVPSGTQVHAALAGKIIVSACDWNHIRGVANGATGFGGLIITESDNPYAPGTKVYVDYAHLNRWSYYPVGATVSQGTVIGLSGGDPTTSDCPGASGGMHLHFQVDKTYPSGGKPWYPTGRTEQADSDFEVTTKTHNPLPFVLGYAYNFTFAEANNKELWGAANINSFGVAGSDLWVDSSSVYPYVGRSSYFAETSCAYSNGYPCSREITLDASIFKRLVITLRFNCTANPTVIYFHGADGVWHGGTFNYTGAGTYTLQMSNLSTWTGIVTNVIVQPSQGCTANPGPQEYFISQMWFAP